jgi:hypothetical protein
MQTMKGANMALKPIGVGSFDGEPVALTSLAIGEAVEGYCVGHMKSKHENGGDNLIFTDKVTGDKFAVYTAGNVKYQIRDNEIEYGYFTRITRLDDKMIKGKKSTQYRTEQDSDDKAPGWKPNVSTDNSSRANMT